MFAAIRKFINKIQNSSETTKKLWLVIFSGVTMLIIVILWTTNLSSSIQRYTKSDTKTEQILKEEKTGFKEIFSAGFKTITQAFTNKLSTGQEFLIKESDRNFILEDLKATPKTKLP